MKNEEEGEEAVAILTRYLNEGKEDVGVLLEKFDTTTYTLVHSYSENIKQISLDTFKYLSQHNYLLSSQCTKVGCRWFYEFTEETKNGFSLYKLFKEEDFPFLKDKKFYIVPRDKSKVYFSDNNEYSFTKIKNHATILTLNDLFYTYCNRRNGFMYRTFCNNYVNVGWYERVYTTQNSNKEVEQPSGEVYEMEKYAKDFDLLTTDGKERYKMNFCFDMKNSCLATFDDNMTEEEMLKKQKSIKENKNNFFATFSIKQAGGGFFSLGTPYFGVDYIAFNGEKPFEEYA